MTNKKTTDKTFFDAQRHLSHMAPIVGIDIKESWQTTVCSHLNTAAQMADIINAAPIETNSIDLANIFLPR